MPFSDLIHTSQVSEKDEALKQSRFRLRGGKRCLQRGSTAAGLMALYESLIFGMHYYIARHERCTSFLEKTDLWDAVALYHALAGAGVFDDPLMFNRFSLSVERALWQETSFADSEITLTEVENLLTKLGVIPFKEAALNGPSLKMT